MSQGRSLFLEICRNIANSLKPKKIWGQFKGRDEHGTEYFEGEVSPHRGRPVRWYTPSDKYEFQQEIPAEWEAWLRHKRKDPPTEEEIQLNFMKMQSRIENAMRLEMQRKKTVLDEPKPEKTGSKFPTYEEYSADPTDFKKDKK